MTLWRYTAVELPAGREGGGKGGRKGGGNGAAQPRRRLGELAGQSAAEVRASLRRVGLQVIQLRPARSSRFVAFRMPRIAQEVLHAGHRRVQEHLRARRRRQRAEFYDSLGMMTSSGLPLLESLESLHSERSRLSRSLRAMLLDLRERLRSGESLAQAMRTHMSWFDPSEIAMVEAGQHAGTLPAVLASMAQRHERAGELSQKLISALAYPLIVLIVGIGVAAFLSVKTLPGLAKILQDARISIPPLTTNVMWAGQMLVEHWVVVVFLICVLPAAVLALSPVMRRCAAWIAVPAWISRMLTLRPRIIRTLALSDLSLRLAELLRSGVPVVDALRVVCPTVRSGDLQRAIAAVADRVEHGADLPAALDDHRWFDAEFRRLIDIGQASGELEQMLQRLGERSQRQARRQIDRLATLLEPAVILALAAFVGTVVMAAILPLVKLKEILG